MDFFRRVLLLLEVEFENNSVLHLSFFIEPFNFKNSLLSDIDTAAGYNSSTNQFTKGILLKEYMYNGITCYSVETWTGSSMTGPKGWTGTWKANT